MTSNDNSVARLRKLPAGPILQSTDLHRNDDTNSSSSESESSAEEEWGTDFFGTFQNTRLVPCIKCQLHFDRSSVKQPLRTK